MTARPARGTGFHKHLNSDGRNTQCFPGLDVWFANGGGTYYNPAFSYATAGTTGEIVSFNNCTYSLELGGGNTTGACREPFNLSLGGGSI